MDRTFRFSSPLAGPAAAALVLLAIHGSVAEAAPAVELLSHRAAYRLSLGGSEGSTKLSQVRGGLVLEFRAACDGWLSQQRLGFVAEAAEGPGFTYDVRFSSWESRDKTQLRFHVRSFDGRELQEEFRGLARLDAPGAKGKARYSQPKGTEVELPPGTIFPTEHVQELIEAARAGERFVTRQVFDGSGEDALMIATAAIGESKTATRPGGGTERRWPVSLAYFPLAKEDMLPESEMTFELAENGVFYDVTLDYGDYTLKAELEQLETFDPPVCK
ncbi:EipB family protein [Benzoatithermus flavus]|uniref:DUF1849 family protein n=1 Tax=Benzoatithermus flavus TaxID=3108223 RepID=A0ABU8XQQ4_9PROT